MSHETSLSVILLAINLILPGGVEAAESLQKIRVGLPSLALTYMPSYTAQEKGLLKKVGLEAEYIQMNTGIQKFFPLAIDRHISSGVRPAISYRQHVQQRRPIAA